MNTITTATTGVTDLIVLGVPGAFGGSCEIDG